jgi:hypothetical protein
MTKLTGLIGMLLALTTGCGSSDGGGPIAAVCTDYCEAISLCTGVSRSAEKQCITRCKDVFTNIDRMGDGDECVTTNLDTFTCATGLVCSELNQFLVSELTEEKYNQRVLDTGKFICEVGDGDVDCCEMELGTVVVACPASFVLQ